VEDHRVVRCQCSHIFWTVGSQTALKLSALRAGRPLHPRRFFVLISVRVWVDNRARVRLKGLGQLKNPKTSSWIEPLTFPACSIVPQATTKPMPRNSILFYFLRIEQSATDIGMWNHPVNTNYLHIVFSPRTLPAAFYFTVWTHRQTQLLDCDTKCFYHITSASNTRCLDVAKVVIKETWLHMILRRTAVDTVTPLTTYVTSESGAVRKIYEGK
jgi:hypothetical protein